MSNLVDVKALMHRETHLCSQSLANGLNCIRKYDFSKVGLFYSGMFSVTIGFERLLKLILLLDHSIKYSKFPDNQYLKSKGHKIDKLIAACSVIAKEYDEGIENLDFEGVFNDELCTLIITFMTDFAIGARYYNLDTLTGRVHGNNEPLARWDNEICSVILERHPLSSKKSLAFNKIPKEIEDISFVAHTSEDGSDVNNIHKLMNMSASADHKQGYSVFYIYKIVSFFLEVLRGLDFKQSPQIYLREIIVNLSMSGYKSSDIRKRIRWDSI